MEEDALPVQTVADTQERTEQPRTTSKEAATAVVRRRSRVRPTQVHLDEASEDHLMAIRKRAVLIDVAVTNSAVLRLALAELVERHGHDGVVTLFAEDENRPRPGRPRNSA